VALGATSLSPQQEPDPEAPTPGRGGVPASPQPSPTTPAFHSPGCETSWVGTALVTTGTATRGPGAAAVSANLTRPPLRASISGTAEPRHPARRALHHPYVCLYRYLPACSPHRRSRRLRGQRDGRRDSCGSGRLRATGADFIAPARSTRPSRFYFLRCSETQRDK